jgi:hypothetical protein
MEQLTISDVILSQGEFTWAEVSETGITFKAETPELEWKRITEGICVLFEKSDRTHCATAMMLGDALRFGEEHFGEKYADVIDATRQWVRLKGINSAKSWQWVASKIPPAIRRLNLTIAHHESVARLEEKEQDEFLKLAEDEALTVRELRAKIRERHPAKPRNSKAPKKTPKVLTIEDMATAKAVAIELSNYLTANEEAMDEKEWRPILEHFGKLLKRRNRGRPRKAK